MTRISIDNNVFRHYLDPFNKTYKENSKIREDMAAFKKIIKLSNKTFIVSDQVKREVDDYENKRVKKKILKFLDSCEEHQSLCRFSWTNGTTIKKDGVQILSKESIKKFNEYKQLSSVSKKDADLIVCSILAKANYLITVDYKLNKNKLIKKYTLEKDNLIIITPSECLSKLTNKKNTK